MATLSTPTILPVVCEINVDGEFEVEIHASETSRPKPTLPILDELQSKDSPNTLSPVDARPSFPSTQRSKSPTTAGTPLGEFSRKKSLAPFVQELLSSRLRRKPSREPLRHSTEFVRNSAEAFGGEPEQRHDIKEGKLLKSSRVRTDAQQTKQRWYKQRKEHKFFRLTEDALEYYQQFNQVKLRKSYPLTSIENVTYSESEPTVFHLLFSKYEMILEANSESEAKDWVRCLKDAWSSWQLDAEINFEEDNTILTPGDEVPAEFFKPADDGGNQDSPQTPSPPPGAPSDPISQSDRGSTSSYGANEDSNPFPSSSGQYEAIRSPRPPSPNQSDVFIEVHEVAPMEYGAETPTVIEAVNFVPSGSRDRISEPPVRRKVQSFTRPRSKSVAALLRRESSDMDDQTLGRNKRKNAFRLARLTPRIERTEEPEFKVQSSVKRHRILKSRSTMISDRKSPSVKSADSAKSVKAVQFDESIETAESKIALDRLHDNYSMVKYPRKVLGIPHERVFKVDRDNLQILWRRSMDSAFRQKSSLKFHKVVEVREGQMTDSFEKFPYEEVKSQSLSLIFEEMTKKYVRLSSIDLICDHPDNYDHWIEGLSSLVSGTKCSIYPHRYETSDPLILWLKQIWSCKSDHHEMKQSVAAKIVRKLCPQLSAVEAKDWIKLCHFHQFKHSQGYVLHWDGFTMLYNLLCQCAAKNSSRLWKLFKQYSVTYPNLGMTVDELRKFLITECYWDPAQTSDKELQLLIKHHDYHHRAFKKYIAKNRPLQYQICIRLLSYAGFLSFLRSRDNAVIVLDHETVYQEMTQPLSHYFINSSHNTYLEAHQLKGKSSVDAYIRALLQGCRCVEIDCWDDTFNVTGLNSKEPVIYHGLTLTTKIPFREVVHTIKDYAFRTSLYPLIISIENHCSEDQQSKMAKIFRAIMGDLLPSENLVESEGRERLPSPEELQGKIILKGSFKGKKTPKISKEVSQSSLGVQQIRHGRTTSTASGISITSGSSIDSEPSSSPKATHRPAPRQVTVVDLAPVNNDEETEFRSRGMSLGRGRGSRHSLRQVKGDVLREECGQDDQELEFEQTSKDLKKLIVYCRAISIKPWSWKQQKQTEVSEMFSFGEPTAVKLCEKFNKEVLCCSERQLVRTYPKGTRFDSSNYDPMLMWTCGIQMVALNYQKPDIHMHLNQGFFRRNGGCGYVLKPEIMRASDPGSSQGGRAPYSPNMVVAHPAVPSIEFEIELISGQNLCPWNKKYTSITVDIHTYGIPHDTGKMSQASCAHNNTLWPQWEEGAHNYARSIFMPDLCLVYFRVEGDRKILYQNCISLVSLEQGIKFVPMRTAGGELVPETGLFVNIKKSENFYESSTMRVARNTSLTSPLETITENPEASINPIAVKKLQRQRDFDYDHSTARRTMSSPPSLTSRGDSEDRGSDSSSHKTEVEIEIGPAAEATSTPSHSISSGRLRSVTVQPSPGTERKAGGETSPECSDNLKEFTLTVQASIEEST